MNTKTISKMIKISKAALYSASAAPFVMRILDAAGVEVDKDVKFYVDVMAPVAAGTAGIACGRLENKLKMQDYLNWLAEDPARYIAIKDRATKKMFVLVETNALATDTKGLIEDVANFSRKI